MKRFCLYILAALALSSACTSIPSNKESNETGGLKISGLPSEQVKAFSEFIITADSPSEGYINFKSSNVAIAKITLCGRRQYKVQTGSPSVDTPVTLTFTQEASGDYPEMTEKVQFTLLKYTGGYDPTIPDNPQEDLEGVKVSFTETTGQVTNPERGFYVARDVYPKTSNLKSAEVKAQRAEGKTLWYLGFYLTDFMKGDISQSFLDKIQAHFDALRDGGAKCVLRFAYKAYHKEGEQMDPEVDIVLRHVEQLKPLLQKNEDVIFVLQAGFVGSWGEWYYTSHFVFQPSSDADYQPRRRLTDALLDAMPESRQIQLRTPQFKMRMYGLSVKDTVTALTAHDGSVKSRLAGHNDCFGASADDYGTFDNESKDREFWKGDTRYLIMGGETCGVSEYCTCQASLQDMKDYHWTYLNSGYNSDVLGRWRKTGCFDTVTACLGYRLVLKDLFYSEDFAAGKPCSVAIRFYNSGFAAPMNPREAVLVWESASGEKTEYMLGSDPRSWQPGFNVVRTVFTPTSSKGTLYLRLSDPLLPERPEYSIAFANENVFDTKTGLNTLFKLQ